MNPNEHFPSEDDFVHALKCRNKTAFEILYDKYAATLLGVVSEIIDDEYRDAVIQEIFMEIWETIPEYNGHSGTLFAWIYHLARNRTADLYRDIKSRYPQPGLLIDSRDMASKKDILNECIVDAWRIPILWDPETSSG